MPKRESSFQIDAPPDRVHQAALKALGELGWLIERSDGEIVVRESPAGLCCSMAPVAARISVGETAGSQTSVEIEVSVPGFGPAPKQQLVDRCRGLEQRITRWTLATPAQPC